VNKADQKYREKVFQSHPLIIRIHEGNFSIISFFLLFLYLILLAQAVFLMAAVWTHHESLLMWKVYKPYLKRRTTLSVRYSRLYGFYHGRASVHIAHWVVHAKSFSSNIFLVTMQSGSTFFLLHGTWSLSSSQYISANGSVKGQIFGELGTDEIRMIVFYASHDQQKVS